MSPCPALIAPSRGKRGALEGGTEADLGGSPSPAAPSSHSGYSSLPDRVLSSLPEGTVLLNKAVRTIQWRGSFHEEGDQARDFPVRVECEDGDAFLADHVIVTVPLGEDTSTFPCPVPSKQGLAQSPSQPPLSQQGSCWKQVWGGKSISDAI